MEHKLIKKIVITGKIVTITGLHIGGTNSAMGIGGPDSVVVRNPIDNKPYIPGSSLKGKLRAMLDWADGTIKNVNMGQVKNGTTQNPEHASVQLFGNAPTNNDKDNEANQFMQRPSKVIFRDALNPGRPPGRLGSFFTNLTILPVRFHLNCLPFK